MTPEVAGDECLERRFGGNGVGDCALDDNRTPS